MICVSDAEMKIVLGIIKKHAPDCDVLAFGSRYKWTPKDYSDLDLAFALPNDEKLDVKCIAALQEAFAESDLPYRVDVVDYNAVSKEFRAVVDEGNEVIYKACKNTQWYRTRLGDAAIQIIDGDRGKNYPNQFRGRGHCLFLSAKNVTSDGFSFDNKQFITKEQDESLRKGKLIRNDVVLTTRGTVGNVALYDEEIPFDHIRINSGMVILRTDESIINPHYLFHVMRSVDIQNQILQMRTGSAQPQFPISHMVNLEIPIPSIETQCAIAATLSCLDDKIENNRRINATLEQMAQTIYARTFPNSDTPTTPIGELIDVRDGTHDSPKPVEQGYPLVTSKHLLSYGVDLASPNRINKADFDKINERSKVDRHDILISMIGTIGLISLIIEREINFAIKNVGLFKTSKTNDWVYFVLCFLKSSEIKNHIGMRLAGSTQKYISLSELRQLPVIIPSDSALNGFNEIVHPMFEEITLRTEENRYLTIIRDALLPRLMSGELLSVADFNTQ